MIAPVSSVHPITSPALRCRGYILASQHPNFPSKARTAPGQGVSPYEVIPCPYEPSSSAVFSLDQVSTITPVKDDEKVVTKGRRHGCVRGYWCERHWCAGCKKGRDAKLGQEGTAGLGHGRLDVQMVAVGEDEERRDEKENRENMGEARSETVEA